MSLKSSISKGLKWETINMISRQFMVFFIFATLARLLEPRSFGLMGLVFVYMGLAKMITEQGIATFVIQRSDLTRTHINTAFWLSLGLAVFLCLATVVVAKYVANIYDEPDLVNLLRWSSLILIINSLSAVQSALLVREMRFRESTIRTMLATLIGGIVGVIMAFNGYGVWALVWQQLTFSITGSLFILAISDFKPSKNFSIRSLRDLLGFGTPLLGSHILSYISSRLDQIIIGRFTGVSTLGLYVVAGKIPEMARMLTHRPLAKVSLPAISKIQNDHRRMCDLIYQGMELVAPIAFAIFVGIALVAPEITVIFFGDKWIAASGPASLLSLYTLISILQIFFLTGIIATGLMRQNFYINLCSTIGVALACLVGIRFSINHVVMGLIMNSLIMSIPTLILLRHRIGLSIVEYIKPCFYPTLAASLMVLSVYFGDTLMPDDSKAIFLLFVKILIGSVTYLIFLLIFAHSTIRKILNSIVAAVKPNDISKSPIR